MRKRLKAPDRRKKRGSKVPGGCLFGVFAKGTEFEGKEGGNQV